MQTCFFLLSVVRCTAAKNSCRVVWRKVNSSSTPYHSIRGLISIKPKVERARECCFWKLGTSDFKNTDFVLIRPLNAISQIDLNDSAGKPGSSAKFLREVIPSFHLNWRLWSRRFKTRHLKSSVWVFGRPDWNRKKRLIYMSTLMGTVEQKAWREVLLSRLQ